MGLFVFFFEVEGGGEGRSKSKATVILQMEDPTVNTLYPAVNHLTVTLLS